MRRYLRPDDRVLDIGTGGGEHLLELATSFGRGIGIDFDPGMIRVAWENADEKSALHVFFEAMDARQLRFPDASFDVVRTSTASC